ncbi:MAG: hypothetical protein ACKO96_35535, partial [Flammeovirgaceae bacterium]
LYYSWGRNFIVFLDGDRAGEKEKKRYLDKFGGIVEGRIFNLADFNGKWKGKEIEDLFRDTDRINFQKHAFPNEEEFSKKKFNIALQELLMNKLTISLTEETQSNLEQLTKFLQFKLESA